MKTTLLFLLFSITVNSQWNYSFDNNKVTWQKVFEVKDTTNYKLYFKENALTTNLDFSRNKTASFSDFFKLEEIKSSKTFFEGFNIGGGITAHVTLEFKNNKYRVTIKDIKTIDKLTTNLGNYTNKNKGNFLSIESFMFQDDKLKKEPIYKDIMMALQHHFINAFTLDYTINNSDDW